jgi:hypothetical protein
VCWSIASDSSGGRFDERYVTRILPSGGSRQFWRVHLSPYARPLRLNIS